MRLGLDLDGVLVNLAPFIIQHWNNDHNTNFVLENLISYFGPLLAEVSQEYFDSWWNNLIKQGLFSEANLYPGAERFLEELKSKGHEIVIITSRSRLGENYRAIKDTIEFLEAKRIPFDELHFCVKKNLVQADIYFEDEFNCIINLVKSGKVVFVPERPWTRKIESDNKKIYKYFSFEEAMRKIDLMCEVIAHD